MQGASGQAPSVIWVIDDPALLRHQRVALSPGGDLPDFVLWVKGDEPGAEFLVFARQARSNWRGQRSIEVEDCVAYVRGDGVEKIGDVVWREFRLDRGPDVADRIKATMHK